MLIQPFQIINGPKKEKNIPPPLDDIKICNFKNGIGITGQKSRKFECFFDLLIHIPFLNFFSVTIAIRIIYAYNLHQRDYVVGLQMASPTWKITFKSKLMQSG